ncbi:hypothetical protein KAR48_03000, partial [bacterium]|nr:hypothetical protein [bacterium]
MKVRLWQRFWLLVVFLLLLAGQVAAHTISLVSVVYDPGSGTTTVTYRLTSGEQPALSHWVFEWCSPGDILGSNYSYDYGDDPFTGVRGIKYEQGFDDNEVRDVWFRLRGIWPMGSAAVGFKAATSTSTTTVSGPVCGSHKAIGTIGDYVWFDTDGDGVQDAGESGISGVQLQLLLSNGTHVGNATTDGSGGYLFTNLAAGNYKVDVTDSSVPSGYSLTTGNDPTSTISLASGQNYLDADFGYTTGTSPTGSIGDYVWHDEDGDGNQDSGESGIGSVTVNLKQGGSTIATQATSSGGGYDFTGLAAGTYVVDVDESTVPSGYTLTTGNEPLTVNLAAGQDYNDA